MKNVKMSKRLFCYGALFAIALSACNPKEEWEIGYTSTHRQRTDQSPSIEEEASMRPDEWGKLVADSLLQPGVSGQVQDPDAFVADSISLPKINPPSDSDTHFFHPHVAGWEEEITEIRLN